MRRQSSLPDHGELEAIVADLQRGVDTEANAKRLFDYYYRAIIEYFQRRGFRRDDCLDLTQEAFLRIFDSISSYRGQASFSTWVYGILANIYRNELRRRVAQKRSGQEVALDTDQEHKTPTATSYATKPPDEVLSNVLYREAVDHLTKAIGDLPPQMRRALILNIYHGHTYREIADLLDLSTNTVKSHLAQAKKHLQISIASPMLRNAEKPESD